MFRGCRTQGVVVQVCCNYNIVFQTLEIQTVKLRPVPACCTSGRGASNLFGPGHCTISPLPLLADLRDGITRRHKRTLQTAMKRAELEKLTSELGQLFDEARETLIKLTCIDKMRYEVGKMNSVGITCCFNDIIYYILYIIFIIFGKVSKMISQGLTKKHDLLVDCI